MFKVICNFLQQRFVVPFWKFSLFLKIGTASLCGLLGYGMIDDSIKTARPHIIVGSIIFMVVFTLGMIEMVSLFEFRGVELFNYGSDKQLQLRDQWLGRFVIRLLLVIGNGALLYEAIHH